MHITTVSRGPEGFDDLGQKTAQSEQQQSYRAKLNLTVMA